jgi:hypothetical protein
MKLGVGFFDGEESLPSDTYAYDRNVFKRGAGQECSVLDNCGVFNFFP